MPKIEDGRYQEQFNLLDFRSGLITAVKQRTGLNFLDKDLDSGLREIRLCDLEGDDLLSQRLLFLYDIPPQPVIIIGEAKNADKFTQHARLKLEPDAQGKLTAYITSDYYRPVKIGSQHHSASSEDLEITGANDEVIISKHKSNRLLIVKTSNYDYELTAGTLEVASSFRDLFSPEGRLLSRSELTQKILSAGKPEVKPESTKSDESFSEIRKKLIKSIQKTFRECPDTSPIADGEIIYHTHFNIDPEQYVISWPDQINGEFKPNINILFIGGPEAKKRLDDFKLYIKYSGAASMRLCYTDNFNDLTQVIGTLWKTDNNDMVIETHHDLEYTLISKGNQTSRLIMVRSLEDDHSRQYFKFYSIDPPDNYEKVFDPKTGILYSEKQIEELSRPQKTDIILSDIKPAALSAVDALDLAYKKLVEMPWSYAKEGNVAVRYARLSGFDLPVIIETESHRQLPPGKSVLRRVYFRIQGIALPSIENVKKQENRVWPLGVIKKAAPGRINGSVVFEIVQSKNQPSQIKCWVERPDVYNRGEWIKDENVLTDKFISPETINILVNMIE